jgi:hypothetical protein
MAQGINQLYGGGTKEQAPPDQQVLLQEVSVEDQLKEHDQNLFQRLSSFGLILSKLTSKEWILIFANTPHFSIDIQVHSENSICLIISGTKPTQDAFLETEKVTGVKSGEWGFPEDSQLKCTIIVSSPAPIGTDHKSESDFLSPI